MTVAVIAAMVSPKDSSQTILLAFPVKFSKLQNDPNFSFPDIVINDHVTCS